ncbi:M23 family metallopeptidase [Stenomitos frigidus]|uniref:M23ase beta-sheet core domain-containing protein n=1 Tax=Stenomitos frigidus ULC18 TaxID=2107698 RepID=A0A2T1E3J0_9CYAN|nr:M23 family metallopeptidase [Stenomitos frigidus]PSB27194.1 hypothetical protein C7B82_17120 [Stenomitos frigidus ULC18]
MSYRFLSVGVPRRYSVPSLPSFSDSNPIPTWGVESPANDWIASDSNPISVWGTEAIAANVSGMEKLRQLCSLNLADLSQSNLPDSLALERDQSRINPFVQCLTFVCVGLSLCLSAHTASDSTLGHTLNLATSIVGKSEAATTANSSHLSQLQSHASIATTSGAASAQKQAKVTVHDRAALGFVQPVEGFPLTSGFGNRVHPLFGDTRFHQGIDLGTPNGTPVKTAKQGVVIFADWDGGYGKTIIIQHEAAYETLYAHLDELLVSVGDRVAQGDIIGLSGSTGYVTGPHLHFEIRVNLVAHNPLDYF